MNSSQEDPCRCFTCKGFRLGALAVLFTMARAPDPLYAQCAAYRVDAIPGPSCFGIYRSWATAINEAGEMCGGHQTCDGNGKGAIWLGQGTWVPLQLAFGITEIVPNAINSDRWVVGIVTLLDEKPPERAGLALYSQGAVFSLGTLVGGNTSAALAVNNHGWICGLSNNTVTGPVSGFVWHDGQMIALDLSLGPYGKANDISDRGFVCGWMGGTPFTGARAFLWHNGQCSDLGTILEGSLGVDPKAINNAGHICGYSIFPGRQGYVRKGFIWQDGVAHELGVVPGD